ncbi:MAG: RluA family pseudouridine synthase [Alphaproteobacteria bacterium]|nr:RluA family pseudouridine synthase [Alphaproteobacteria bacterium]
MTNDASQQQEPPAPGERRQEVTAGPGDAGERLDRMLATRLGGLSRTRLKQLILEERITRDGATISDPSMRVKSGDRFVLTVPPPLPDRPTPQGIALAIRHEDDHLIVLDKPAGLVVHPAPGNLDRTLVNALLAHCGDRLAGIGGVRRPGIVHRLDKDTSGLMVVAKSDAAHAALAADFAARRIRRAYRALVWGIPAPTRGEIHGNIGRSPSNRKKMAVLQHGGKPALTHYEVMRTFHAAVALVECRLATGRTHQIRVHMAARGHSVIGDPVYGSRRPVRRAGALPGETLARLVAFPRQALHAYLLGFKHPATGEMFEFTSDLPNDIANLISLLEEF